MHAPRLRHFLAALVLLSSPVMADLAPIATAPGIKVESLGVYCNLESEGREDAPETDLGYIDILSGMPEFAFQQREIPARLGISFGLVAISDRDIFQAKIETLRPGAAKPDVWYSDFVAGEPALRGFSFDFAHELTPGIWQMDAYDGAVLLYSVEFEVLPGSELPGISSDCNLMS